MSPTFVVCCSSGAWSVRRNKGCQPSLLFTHKVHTNKDRSYRLESTASPGCTTSPSGPWLSHATVSSHVSAALSEACCLTYLLLLTGPLPRGPIRWGFSADGLRSGAQRPSAAHHPSPVLPGLLCGLWSLELVWVIDRSVGRLCTVVLCTVVPRAGLLDSP